MPSDGDSDMRHYFIQLVVLVLQLIAPCSLPYIRAGCRCSECPCRCGPCVLRLHACGVCQYFPELDVGKLRTSTFPSFLIRGSRSIILYSVAFDACKIQIWTIRRALGCEKCLPGPAWLLLSNTCSSFKSISVIA